MENCYLECIPRDYLRGAAGFDPHRKNYFIPRSTIQPNDTLISTVFPTLSSWREKLVAGDIVDVSVCLELQFKLLYFLAIVFMQDSVVIRRSHPHLAIWSHSLFLSPDYVHFDEQLWSTINNGESPLELRIQEVLPDVLTRLDEHSESLRTAISATSSMVEQLSSKSHIRVM
jgi:hypothetical protein